MTDSTPAPTPRISRLPVVREILGFAARNWWRVALVSLLSGVLASVYVLSLPLEYVSRGAIYIMSQSTVNVDPALASLGITLQGDEMRGYVISLLSSASCQTAVIKQLSEKEREQFWAGTELTKEEQTMDEARIRLKEYVTIDQGRNNTPIAVVAKTNYPELSQALAVHHVKYVTTLLEKDNNRDEKFLSEQVKLAMQNLSKAERRLREYSEERGVSVPLDVLGEEEYKAFSESDQKLAEAEVALSSTRMQLQASGDVTAHLALKAEEAGLSGKVEALREVVDRREELIRGLPETAEQYTSLTREVRRRENVLRILVEGYETARINNAKKTIPYRVVDSPELPQKPLDKKLMLKVAFGLLAGFGLGIGLCALWEEATGKA